MSDLYQNIVISLVFTLLGLLLPALFGDYLEDLLARILGRITPLGKRDVRGIWKSTYCVEKNGKTERHTQLIEIQRVRSQIIGRSFSGNDALPQIKGRIQDETFITGTWKETINSFRYYGAFQLRIDLKGEVMKGLWIGYNSDNRIHNGTWKLTRISRKTGEEAQKKAALIRNT